MVRKARIARYPIRTVARMTGLGIDTLRAWERRHDAVKPTRDDRGRMYTDADVRRLRLLRRAVEQGHSIGRATKLKNAELEQFGTSLEPLVTTATERVGAPASPFDRTAMLDALGRFDQTALGTALGGAAALLRPTQFVGDVALPLLADVAERCRGEGESQAEAHLALAAIRNVLGWLLHRHAGGAGARVLFATLDGDGHEIGVMGAAVLAASGGLDAVYLGADVPADDLVRAASRAEADVVVVGVGNTPLRDRTIRELSAIARGLSPDVEIWMEGPAAESIAARVGARVEALVTFRDLTAHLTRIGARLA